MNFIQFLFFFLYFLVINGTDPSKNHQNQTNQTIVDDKNPFHKVGKNKTLTNSTDNNRRVRFHKTQQNEADQGGSFPDGSRASMIEGDRWFMQEPRQLFADIPGPIPGSDGEEEEEEEEEENWIHGIEGDITEPPVVRCSQTISGFGEIIYNMSDYRNSTEAHIVMNYFNVDVFEDTEDPESLIQGIEWYHIDWPLTPIHHAPKCIGFYSRTEKKSMGFCFKDKKTVGDWINYANTFKSCRESGQMPKPCPPNMTELLIHPQDLWQFDLTDYSIKRDEHHSYWKKNNGEASHVPEGQLYFTQRSLEREPNTFFKKNSMFKYSNAPQQKINPPIFKQINSMSTKLLEKKQRQLHRKRK